MSIRKPGTVGAVIVIAMGAVTAIIFACGGTVKPNCFQTAWLAKFVPSTIVLPTAPGAITVPVGVLPYVLWNTNPACAQPVGATLELTFVCTPIGGAPVTVGPLSFAVATPTVPGPQAVTGGTVPFVIPAGTLSPGTPYACTISGMYTVGFGGGLGATSVIGMGDTEVCLVPPSPDDETKPRLGMELLFAEGAELFTRCRRGDQTINYYLIENNDPNESVDLTFATRTNQVAGMPGGTDTDATLYAISNPTPGTDAFPQEIDRSVGSLLALPNPEEVDPREVTTTLTLEPRDVAIMAVAIRSFGMCADGSCAEVLTKVTGEFSGGDPALGCAGTALLVDGVDAKSPLCEVTDTLKVSPTVDAQWTRATYDGDDHINTHFAGNLPDSQGGPGTQTTGAVLQDQFNIEFFNDTASDYIRLDAPPTSTVYRLQAFPQSSNFLRQTNDVNMIGLPESGSVRAPLIYRDQQETQLGLTFDFSADMLVIDDPAVPTGQQVSISGLPNSLPDDYVIDEGTCRQIQCSGIPDTPLMETNPKAIAELFADSTPSSALRFEIEVFDPRSGVPIAWMASSNNAAIGLAASSGAAGENIVVTIDPDLVAESPDTTICGITVTGAAMNSPINVPVALRRFNLTVTQDPGNGNSNGGGMGGDMPCGACGDAGVVGFVMMIGGMGLLQRRNRRRRQ